MAPAVSSRGFFCTWKFSAAGVPTCCILSVDALAAIAARVNRSLLGARCRADLHRARRIARSRAWAELLPGTPRLRRFRAVPLDPARTSALGSHLRLTERHLNRHSFRVRRVSFYGRSI